MPKKRNAKDEKKKSQPKKATYEIFFPRVKSINERAIVNELKWWNTHYKAHHELNGGRIEVIFVPTVKGFNDEEWLKLKCPYCIKPLHYKTEAIDGVKGNIRCMFCKGKFGVHPSGQVFVVRDVGLKQEQVSLGKTEVLNWLKQHTRDVDAYVQPTSPNDRSVTVEITFSGDEDNRKDRSNSLYELRDFADEMDRSKFEYRRL